MGTCWEGHSKQGLGHGSSSTDTRPRPVMPDSSARCQPTVTSQDIPQEGHETFQLWGWGYIVSLWSHVKQLQLPMSLRARDHQATENWMFRAYSNTHTQLTYSTHIHTYTHTHIHTYWQSHTLIRSYTFIYSQTLTAFNAYRYLYIHTHTYSHNQRIHTYSYTGAR